MLASRASTWPRDHFCRSTRASAPILADEVERVLADIDADPGPAATPPPIGVKERVARDIKCICLERIKAWRDIPRASYFLIGGGEQRR